MFTPNHTSLRCPSESYPEWPLARVRGLGGVYGATPNSTLSDASHGAILGG